MKSDFKKDKEALPAELRDAYDDTLQHVFGGVIPKRSVRLDMMTACVEAFDYMVKLIARSKFCILSFEQTPQAESYKASCSLNCERCIRSYVYSALDHEKMAVMTAKENKA